MRLRELPASADEACVGASSTAPRKGFEPPSPPEGVLTTFDCNGPTTVTTQAEIVIDNDVILDGEGNLSVSAPECGKWLGDPPLVLPCHRIFSVPSGITAELIGVRVANGCSKDGSGILNLGTLRLSRTSVRDNGWQHEWDEFCEYAPCGGRGGGIYNAGTLTLTDSSVSGKRHRHSQRGRGDLQRRNRDAHSQHRFSQHEWSCGCHLEWWLTHRARQHRVA